MKFYGTTKRKTGIDKNESYINQWVTKQTGRRNADLLGFCVKDGLTQAEAGRRMGIAQPKVSEMMRGKFDNLSERKLMECLNRLGYDIEIKVRPTVESVGHLTLAIA